jgi:two-component system LytT family response regulator
VVDYLVKPVSVERFMKACNKANELHELRTKQKESPNETQSEYFFINVDYSLLKVVFKDVIYIEGLKDYIKIHLKSTTKPIVARMSMKSIEEQLPPSMFIRVQKSYIISKEYITAIRKNSIFIGNIEIPVGDNYRDALASLTGRTLQ